MIKTFNKGDLLIDPLLGEIGLLLCRYDIIDCSKNPIWAWKILWAGLDFERSSRIQSYTESGMSNMVHTKVFIHYKIDDNLRYK